MTKSETKIANIYIYIHGAKNCCFPMHVFVYNLIMWDEYEYAEVPGLPIIGNLLQLKEKKPYKTFTKWTEKYGPVYSIRTGAKSMIVLNTTEVAKEVNILHIHIYKKILHKTQV